MAPEALLSLLLTCSAQVHPETAWRVVKHESSGNPYAIGINGPYRLTQQPKTKEQAVSTALLLIKHGLSIDMGLGQINSKNLSWLGLSVEQIFDPCQNLGAMQTVLTGAYARGVRKYGHGQRALDAALSEYNTGSQTRGLQNGYVQKIYRVKVPTIVRAAGDTAVLAQK